MQSRSLVLMNLKQSKVLRGYLPLDGLLQVAARAIALRSQSQVLLWNRRELDVGEARDGCVVRVGEQSVVSEMVACN